MKTDHHPPQTHCAARKNGAQNKKTSKIRGLNIAIICFERYLPGLSAKEFIEYIPDDFGGRVQAIEPKFGSGIVIYRSSKPVIDHERLASHGLLEVIGVVGEGSLCGRDYISWLNANDFYPQNLPLLCEIDEAYLLGTLRVMAQSKGFTTP
jgi:hypothetical protein